MNSSSDSQFIYPLIHPRDAIVSSYPSSSMTCRTVAEPPHALVLASSRVLLPRGGTRCERRTTSGPERASLLTPSGNSIRRPAGRPVRPANPAIGRDFHGVTRFPADITFGIYGASVEVRSATVDWSYALTPREYAAYGRGEREDAGPRGLADRQGSPPKSRSGDITARWVIHVRASKQLPSDDATN